MRSWIMLAILLLGPLAAQAENQPFRVVASIVPLAEIASAVVGEAGSVEALVPPNASPHDFALSPKQAARLYDADVVVTVGLGLETFLSKALGQAAEHGATLIVAAEMLNEKELCAVSKMGLKAVGACDHDHGHAHESDECTDDHGHFVALDPHIWLDPTYAVDIAKGLAKELGKQRKDLASDFKANAKAFSKRVMAEHKAIVASLREVEPAPVVTFHDAYRYLLHRWQFPIASVVLPSPESAPTPKELAALSEIIAAEGVKVLYVEPQFDSSFVRSLASDLGLKVLELDPLGKRGENGEGYLAMLRANGEALVAGAK